MAAVARIGHSSATVLVGLLCALHIAGLLVTLDHPGLWFTERPVLNADWGLHFHHLKSLVGFWDSGHRLWGYNPFFMAGYPSNTFQDLSIKLFELAAVWTPLANPVQAFKIWVFLATAAVPWIAYFTFRNLFGREGESKGGAVLAALLATASWWNSFPREMFFYGMVGFPLASSVAFLAFSFLNVALGKTAGRSAAAIWFLGCTVLIPLHAQAVTVLIIPGLVIFLGNKAPRRRLWAGAALLAAVIANGFWLLPALTHLEDDASSAIIAFLPIYNSLDPWTFLKDYTTTQIFWTNRTMLAAERPLRIVLLILGAVGFVELARRGRRNLALALGLSAASLFVIAYFGSFVARFAAWQPLRFKVPLDTALAIGAAYALIPHEDDRGRRGPRYWKGALLALGLLGMTVNVLATETSGKLKLRTALEPPATDVVRWLYSIVPRTGRVLFEESGDETDFVYSQMYLSSLLPHITGHQLIGGPINLYNDRHHFAEFHSGMFLKRHISSFSDEELRQYFEIYNIVAIVAYHPASLRRLFALQEVVTPLESSGRACLLRVNREPSWFLSGNGRVKANLNRIECTEVSGPEILLKYHWVKGLRSEPETEITPAWVAGDPIPFIKISNPPPLFTLSIGPPSGSEEQRASGREAQQ